MRTRLFALTFAAAAAAGPLAGQTAPQDWTARLRAAIERAVAQNPEISSMEARIEAARQRALQADALPDPELEAGIKDFPVAHPSLSRDDFTMETIELKQRFPGFGKLSAGRRAARAEFEGMEAEHVRHVIEIGADVADSFFHLAELDRKIVILEQTRQRLSDASISARERYRVGKGVQADVLRADLEKTALDDRLASLKAARRSEVARWNALQNLPAVTDVAPIGFGPDFEERITARPIPSAEDLSRKAGGESPAVEAALAEVRRAEERLEQARLERRPDWTLMTYYARREKFEDLAGFTVSINLPWAHPHRLEERRAEGQAEVEAARANLTAVRNTLRRDIEQSWSELARSRDQSRLYRESILPQAEINYRAAREAYAVGAIDFLTFVRAATDLAMYEAEAVERETGVARAVAALQKAAGLPLVVGTPQEGEQHAKE